MTWTMFFQIVMLVIVVGLILDMIITSIGKARTSEPVEERARSSTPPTDLAVSRHASGNTDGER